MSVANVVSMEFESAQALQDFGARYHEVASLMKEIIRVKGDVMVKHIMPAPTDK